MFYQENISNRFRKKRVLLLGDFMLDVYTMGEVVRISPEAPVPVLQVKEERCQAGGAGNTLLNLLALGMEVIPLGRVGADEAGQKLKEEITKEGVEGSTLLVDSSFVTPRKNRMIAEYQQIVRVDWEEPSLLSEAQEAKVMKALPLLLAQVDIVAISDYAKGFLTPRIVQSVMQGASCPVIVDPKGRDFSRYRGATLLKPNLGEAKAAAALSFEASLEEVAEAIFAKVDITALMITRSKEGISLFTKGEERKDFPARVQEVRDVTGAGDTVLAVMTATRANGFTLEEGAFLSNIAASLAIRKVGCARISWEEIMEMLPLRGAVC